MTAMSRCLFRTLPATLLGLSLLAIQSSPSKADQTAEFYSIDCIPELGTLKIDAFRLWNVDEYIWPSPPIDGTDRRQEYWEKHLANLRHLEEQYGIYVINQHYGRWDERTIECQLDDATISMDFEKEEIENGIEGQETRVYRGAATISIRSRSGKILWQNPLEHERAIFQVLEGRMVYRLCRSAQDCNPQRFKAFDLEDAQ
jgi:hypothetical protein